MLTFMTKGKLKDARIRDTERILVKGEILLTNLHLVQGQRSRCVSTQHWPWG